MAPEARGTNEASRRAENALTLTRLHPIVPVSPGCFCAYVFFLLLAFLPPSSALRIRRVVQGCHAFPLRRLSALRGLPALRAPLLRGLSRHELAVLRCPSCPSRLPGLRELSVLRGLAARRGLPAFAGSLVCCEQFAPCSEIL